MIGAPPVSVPNFATSEIVSQYFDSIEGQEIQSVFLVAQEALGRVRR